MKTCMECVPCLVRQTCEAAAFATEDETAREEILRESLRKIADIRMDQSPPHMAVAIHRLIRERTGVADPYREAKSRANQAALALFPRMRELVRASADPFAAAVRLAIAGNVIDLGAPGCPGLDELPAILERAVEIPLAGGGLESLRAAVNAAQNVLILGDNAGEIVFDRILLEAIPAKRKLYAVKGAPILNDATREDAREAALSEWAEVVENGSDAPGTILETCSAAFRRQFEAADVVIAKGQGNYETLSAVSRPKLYFLLKVKCPAVARHLSAHVGDCISSDGHCSSG